MAVASAVGRNAARPQVIALLDRYFSAINQHDYAAYAQLLDPQALQRSPASAFYAGDGSTADTGETLTGLADVSSGGVAAAVTFTSHQQPADSPDHSDCDNWSITLYLVPQGSGYLIGLPRARVPGQLHFLLARGRGGGQPIVQVRPNGVPKWYAASVTC